MTKYKYYKHPGLMRHLAHSRRRELQKQERILDPLSDHLPVRDVTHAGGSTFLVETYTPLHLLLVESYHECYFNGKFYQPM